MKPSPRFLPPFPSFVNLSLSLHPIHALPTLLKDEKFVPKREILIRVIPVTQNVTIDVSYSNVILRNKLQNDPSLTRDGSTRGILRRKETELTGEFASNPPTVERKAIKEEKG